MRLFRFQPFTKFSIQNLTQKQNWASNISNFNDPLEFPIDGTHQWNDEGEYKMLSCEEDSIRRTIQSSINEIGVVSYSSFVSEINPDPELNILMWSHYGDSHKGFCLVFDVEEPIPNNIKKVKYQNEFPRIKYFEKADFTNILIVKNSNWSYECEYREVVLNGNRGINFPGKLVEIVFGCRTTVEDMNFTLKLCDSLFEHEIVYSQCFIKEGTLRLSKSTWVTHKKGDSIPKQLMKKTNNDSNENPSF